VPWHYLKPPAVISNEERNLLLHKGTATADFSPDKTGFEMTVFFLKVVPWTLTPFIDISMVRQ
jgi:hypothetical protein